MRFQLLLVLTFAFVSHFYGQNSEDYQLCNDQHIYAVDNYLLEAAIGNYERPTINPSYQGGFKSLKKYYKKHPLPDKEADGLIFRVVIAFTVNCDGKAGNFKIITKGENELAKFADQLLEMVKVMPQNWQAGIKNNAAIDCYQILAFTVAGGDLGNVSYIE